MSVGSAENTVLGEGASVSCGETAHFGVKGDLLPGQSPRKGLFMYLTTEALESVKAPRGFPSRMGFTASGFH